MASSDVLISLRDADDIGKIVTRLVIRIRLIHLHLTCIVETGYTFKMKILQDESVW